MKGATQRGGQWRGDVVMEGEKSSKNVTRGAPAWEYAVWQRNGLAEMVYWSRRVLGIH
jgi:hypothetical protein